MRGIKDVLIDAIDTLTKHSFLAKCQAQYLNDKKQSLHYAENDQFLIQSYHWSKEWCTLHPVVIYFKDDTGSLQHISICFISDDNSQDK